MTGLMAAREVSKTGKRVLIFDKGKSVGGRMATRRIGSGTADHGAQFFTVRAPQFRTLLNEWLKAGLAFEWSRGWSDGSLVSTRDGHPRYAINGGMNALMKHLAVGLDVRVNVRATSMHAIEGGWEIRDEAGVKVSAKAVLLTAPVPQSSPSSTAARWRLPPRTGKRSTRSTIYRASRRWRASKGASTCPLPARFNAYTRRSSGSPTTARRGSARPRS
ncbi:MAG: FAD-dependent oxidoreductase [Chloroflexi bacterium]|nr:FAD-dependent oxidoreductase [Chloroflexota bacterium]